MSLDEEIVAVELRGGSRGAMTRSEAARKRLFVVQSLAIVYNTSGNVLLAKRAFWTPFKGEVDIGGVSETAEPGEAPESTARRGILQELRVASNYELVRVFEEPFRYILDQPEKYGFADFRRLVHVYEARLKQKDIPRPLPEGSEIERAWWAGPHNVSSMTLPFRELTVRVWEAYYPEHYHKHEALPAVNLGRGVTVRGHGFLAVADIGLASS